MTGWNLDTALVSAVLGLVSGWFVPALIARIPEPADPDAAVQDAGAVGEDPAAGTAAGVPVELGAQPKQTYREVAASPGLSVRTSVVGGVVAGLVGARVGWSPELSFLLYLVPVGVALAVVDWRTRLLPTRVIAPSYVVVALLALASAAGTRDWHALAGAGWGWLVSGGTFFALWFVYPRGMGYGDVRLSGVLGIALGYLGWAELLTGVYAGFLLGGVGGLLLSSLRLVDRKAYPFGPFMLLGALLGVLLGPGVAAWYA